MCTWFYIYFSKGRQTLRTWSSLEPCLLWCPFSKLWLSETTSKFFFCYITVDWIDAHFQNHHAPLCAGEPLHLASQTHFHAAQSKEQDSFEAKAQKVSTSEWNQMLLWAKKLQVGDTLLCYFQKLRSKKSSNMLRVALNVANNIGRRAGT